MNTPRTEKLMDELASQGFNEERWYATEKLAKHSRQLETELAAMTKERDEISSRFDGLTIAYDSITPAMQNAMHKFDAACLELAEMKEDRESEQRWASQYKSERDKWTDLAAKYAQEREHNANMALAYQADLKAEREKVAKLEDIIRSASTKFWQDGPDGEIAAAMFRILGEALNETK